MNKYIVSLMTKNTLLECVVDTVLTNHLRPYATSHLVEV